MNSKGTTVITGASSGIGAIYADRPAHGGYGLILVARDPERLDALALNLAGEVGRLVEVPVADLGKKVDIVGVEDMLRSDTSICVMVNNAGIGATTPLIDSNIFKMHLMTDLIASSWEPACERILEPGWRKIDDQRDAC